MMQFLLHVTCSCILHAYVFLFTYSYYCELFWDFSDCLFLSPSLSLLLFLFTLVISIAPKCKSTPARNPLRSRASSSSDSTPLSLWFRDDDAHKAFSENFSRWGVFGTPSHFSGLHRHWPSHCHSQSGMGVTVWCLGHLSFHAYPRVLLQHARDWSFSASFLHSRSRYAHSCHTVTCCGCASGP